MTTVKRIIRRSERHLIPRRPCPDCRTLIGGHWKEHPGYAEEIDPEGDVTWHCYGSQCLNGQDGF